MDNPKQSTPKQKNFKFKGFLKLIQACPKCGYPIGVIAGSKEAVCRNCGFKDPCCE